MLRWAGEHWPRSPRLPRFLRLATILSNLGETDETAYYLDLCFLKPPDTHRLLGRDPGADMRLGTLWESVTAPYRRCPSRSPLQRAQYADLLVYLPNDPLVKVDRMSMQHSLEVRCPLLDHRVVEFAFRVPTERKMPGLKSKHLLRTIGRRRLPAENIDLPKKGFTAPVSEWLTGTFRDRFVDEVLAPGAEIAGHLDQALLRRWHQDHCARRADRTYPLWAAWMFARWLAAQK